MISGEVDFIGRASHLAFLEEEYRKRRSSLVPVYGRRRVGKSALIARFVAKKPCVYCVGTRLPAELQRREFLKAAAVELNDGLLAAAPWSSWKEALSNVVSRFKGPRRLVLVLDEFQWLAQEAPELPHVLQELWDRDWQHSGKVFLILCGSFIGFMERKLLGQKAPLYGRRTGQIFLKPFDYREAAGFHASYSLSERARTYFLCGGIPLYLRAFDPGRSVEENIRKCFLDEHAPLHLEPEFLLREELQEVQSYQAILMRLGERAMSALELGNATGLGPSVQYHLHQLTQLGYVAKRYPLTGGRPMKRWVRYVLHDPLLRFWFRFVLPNASFLLKEGAPLTFDRRIAPELDSYFGSCFEGFCREGLRAMYAREGVPAEVGQFWSKDAQIDVVGLREDGWTDLGECKWGAVRSAKGLVAELEEKVRHFPNPRSATIGRRIFTRTRVGSPAAGVQWHTLDDLYEADTPASPRCRA